MQGETDLLLAVDYVCPFSAKLSLAIDSVLKPLFAPGGKYAGKVKVIFRNQVQPWHGSSTFVHEAGLAVRAPLPARHSPPNLRGREANLTVDLGHRCSCIAMTGRAHRARGVLEVLARALRRPARLLRHPRVHPHADPDPREASHARRGDAWR